MRVEVRRRPNQADAVPTPKRSANANSAGLVKAYSDSCFESSTNFYIASPDHPKLGQWAKPSTLKYSQFPQQIDPIPTKCLDDALLVASSHGKSSSRRPRTAGCSSRPVGRGGGSHRTSRARDSSANSAPSSSVAKSSRPAVEPARKQRPISPPGTTVSSIQGQREAPRIDTPISGRVAPLHHRSFTTSTLPASPTLCGSFDRHHHPRIRSAVADTCGASLPVTFDGAAGAVDSRAGGGQPPVLLDMRGARLGVKRTGFEEEERGELRLRHEEEQADEPDVRYRVEKLNGSLVGEENSSTAGGRARQLEGHHSVSATMSQANLPVSIPTDDQALPREGGKLPPDVSLGKEGGRGGGVDGAVDGVVVDPWVASQVDPFMSSLREALLRDRPPDVPAYVSDFSADRQRQRNQ